MPSPSKQHNVGSQAELQRFLKPGESDDKDLELLRRIAANPVQQAELQAQAQLTDHVKNNFVPETSLQNSVPPIITATEAAGAATERTHTSAS